MLGDGGKWVVQSVFGMVLHCNGVMYYYVIFPAPVPAAAVLTLVYGHSTSAIAPITRPPRPSAHVEVILSRILIAIEPYASQGRGGKGARHVL